MDRRIDWIVRKGALAIALYCAVVGDAGWLQYAISAAVWWPVGVMLWAAASEGSLRFVPAMVLAPAVALTFDLSVLAAMFLAHWYWTAFAYAITCGYTAVAQARAASKP